MADQPAQPTVKSVPPKWIDLEAVPIHFCNQFVIQNNQNEFVLSLGYATGPLFLKPPTQEEIDAIKTVNVRPLFRFAMTPDRLIELIGILEINLRQYQNKAMES